MDKSLTYIVGQEYREPMTGLVQVNSKHDNVLAFTYINSFHYAELRFLKLFDNTRVPPYRLTEIFDNYQKKGINELRVELPNNPNVD